MTSLRTAAPPPPPRDFQPSRLSGKRSMAIPCCIVTSTRNERGNTLFNLFFSPSKDFAMHSRVFVTISSTYGYTTTFICYCRLRSYVFRIKISAEIRGKLYLVLSGGSFVYSAYYRAIHLLNLALIEGRCQLNIDCVGYDRLTQ